MIGQEQREFAVFDKRKHIRITHLCNNNCLFCLDAEGSDKTHKSLEEIKKGLEAGIAENCTRLILSGGEATIHPNFFDVVRLGKQAGYKKIQIISNGRMFSYTSFLKKATSAGLGEITFSIHGHTPELHDFLTNSKGSFNETVKGIKNALELHLIVNADIVLNKQNYKFFPQIMGFLLGLGIREFDILHPVPFGNAWKNKEMIYYDIKRALPYIHDGFNLAEKKDAILWTNRFPAKYLVGFEHLIQDSHKLSDEIEGRKILFQSCLETNNNFPCYGGRCALCNMENVCCALIKSNKKLKKGFPSKKQPPIKKVIINQSNYTKLPEIAKRLKSPKTYLYIFDFGEPPEKLSDYKRRVVRLKDVIPYLTKTADILGNKLKIRNIPACFLGKDLIRHIDYNIGLDPDPLTKDNQLDITKFVKDFAKGLKIKGLCCKKCKYTARCKGIFQKYIILFGFKELQPL